jgi:hypothetical protein
MGAGMGRRRRAAGGRISSQHFLSTQKLPPITSASRPRLLARRTVRMRWSLRLCLSPSLPLSLSLTLFFCSPYPSLLSFAALPCSSRPTSFVSPLSHPLSLTTSAQHLGQLLLDASETSRLPPPSLSVVAAAIRAAAAAHAVGRLSRCRGYIADALGGGALEGGVELLVLKCMRARRETVVLINLESERVNGPALARSPSHFTLT